MIPDTNVGGKVATLDNPFGCGKKVRLPMSACCCRYNPGRVSEVNGHDPHA